MTSLREGVARREKWLIMAQIACRQVQGYIYIYRHDTVICTVDEFDMSGTCKCIQGSSRQSDAVCKSACNDVSLCFLLCVCAELHLRATHIETTFGDPTAFGMNWGWVAIPAHGETTITGWVLPKRWEFGYWLFFPGSCCTCSDPFVASVAFKTLYLHLLLSVLAPRFVSQDEQDE